MKSVDMSKMLLLACFWGQTGCLLSPVRDELMGGQTKGAHS